MCPALGPLRIHLDDVHGRTVCQLTHDVREIVLIRCRTEVDVAVTLHDTEVRVLLQHPLQRIRLDLIGEPLNLRLRRNRLRLAHCFSRLRQRLLFHRSFCVFLPAAHQYADQYTHKKNTQNERRNQKDPLPRLIPRALFFPASTRLSHKNAPIYKTQNHEHYSIGGLYLHYFFQKRTAQPPAFRPPALSWANASGLHIILRASYGRSRRFRRRPPRTSEADPRR